MVIKPSRYSAAALVGVSIVLASTARAQVEVEFTPGIFAGVNYTDNLRLQNDENKIEQLSYVITPEISFSRRGPRMQTLFDYRAQGIFYDTETRDDAVLSFLRFNNDAELVENNLFFDVSANITQQILDPGEAIPISGINDVGNRAEVLTAFAVPRWESTLGGFAQTQLSYRAGIVDYKEPELRDSKEGRLDAALSGFLGRNSTWLLAYYDAGAEYDTDEEVNLSTFTAELAIGIGAKTALVLTGGYDSNNFVSALGERDVEDDFWLVGFRGTLGRFTEYDVRAGERFFGDTYAVNITRERGNLTGTIDYSESVTSQGQAQLDFESVFDFVSDITGEELPVPLPNAYVRKRLQVSGDWQLPTGVVQFAVFDEDRQFLDGLPGDNDERMRGASTSYRWTGGTRTTVTVDLSWRRFELRNSTDTPEDIRVQLRTRREFANNTFLNVTVWRNKRGATVPTRAFTENAGSIGLTKQF
ncbi:MAG: TIGR03016 family PEP-CTERM system-associated outer membrane protein [Pseudomonadota bacterium]